LIRLEVRSSDSPWVTIVGVIGDVRNPIGADVQPTVYRPWAQQPNGGAFFIHTHSEPIALSPAVRRVLRAIDPFAPESRVVDLEREVANYISPQRFTASLLGGFAGFGLLLAVAGVYGVTRYWVQTRIPEMGIRIALGAQPNQVIAFVLRKAALASGIGAVAGAIGALVLRDVIASQLYGVSPTDPVVFAAAPLIMAATAMTAAFLPARMAATLDPLSALRQE
jgi:ABC-type antimicrobial peptide transport system permease subunit